MSGNTKNLGQVAGVHIGNTQPDNTTLIWFDNTPSQMVHKIYDPGLSNWAVLDRSIISPITYSELVNIAKNVGLTVGQWFQIKDRSNALAVAITTTKVQYDDELGNILIDDLGTNIQYHVTSSNLLIDDVSGVFDNVNKKLVFRFVEKEPYYETDYVVGKAKRGDIWSLVKFKLSSFLSKEKGNSVTWNNGFFFNFLESLKNQFDKRGGVVSKDTYDTDIQLIHRNIQNIGNINQNIIANTIDAINLATEDEVIYSKKSPTIETGGEPTDAAKGDSLITILSKFQRYITRLKRADGIRMAANYTDNLSVPSYVNSNDTVNSAIAKLQQWIKKLRWGDNIKVSEKKFPPVVSDSTEEISKEDSIASALSKLLFWVKNISREQLLDGVINFNKISKHGVLPTDIFRIDLTTSFDFRGGGLGGVVVQNYGNFLFGQDPTHPYSPYRMQLPYNPSYPKLLSFVPVIPVLPNVTNQYSNAGSLVHYVDGDATLQAIFQIPKPTYDTLHAAGNRYFKCVIQADVYTSLTDEKIVYTQMNYVNIINITLRQATLNIGGKQNIIFKLHVTPVVDTNG